MTSIRFLHIPKTAGSTLTAILREQYQGQRIFSFRGDALSDLRRFRELPKPARRKVGLFIGHAPLATRIPEANEATLITLLREPVSRVMSFCQHVSEGKSPDLLAQFPPETFDLDAFLDSGNGQLSNLQTRLLLDHKAAQDFSRARMSLSAARDLALENLFGKVAHFGIQEHFDDSLFLFKKHLRWSMPCYRNRNCKNTRKLVEFKSHHLERIAAMNEADLEIYQAASARFRALLRQERNGAVRRTAFKLALALSSSFRNHLQPLAQQAAQSGGRLLRSLRPAPSPSPLRPA